MKLLSKLNSLFDRIISLFAVFAAIVLAFITLAVSADVTMRYFFHKPLIWATEVTEISLLYITFLGIAWVLKRNGHVTLDFLINRVGHRAKLILEIINSVFGMAVCCVLFYYGALTTWDHWLRGVFETTILSVPNVYVLVIIPIGSFLFFIQFIRQTCGFFCQLRAPRAKKSAQAT